MANQITDNRTQIDAADADTFDLITGSPGGTLDTEIFIQGTGSIGLNVTNTRAGLLFDAGATTSAWANSVFYLWINCGIVGLLDDKINGGFTIRFAGQTASDFFEFNVGGRDSWPVTVEGGWAQFVVDVEANPSNTGGTAPGTDELRYVGYSAITATVMTRMVDNTWLDEIRRLADGTPGIIIEGRNGGTTDWTFQDILTELGSGNGTFKKAPGGSFILNTPIQFGIADSTIHRFTDSNQIILWDDQEFAASDLYGLSALGGTGGTTLVELGLKTGSGDDATGAQGVIFSASALLGGTSRWFMDFDDPDLDQINFYGCTFIHGAAFQLDDPAVSVISSVYIDCNQATISNSEQLRNAIIDANTADAVGFMVTDDITDIIFCSFQFSDGHGIEVIPTLITPQISKGNLFTGYGANDSNDAAVFNNAGGSIVINVSSQGDTPTVRTLANTTVNNNINATVTVKDEASAVIVGAEVSVRLVSDNSEILGGTTNGAGQVTGTVGASAGAVQVRVRKGSGGGTDFIPVNSPQTVGVGDFEVTITMVEDINNAT